MKYEVTYSPFSYYSTSTTDLSLSTTNDLVYKITDCVANFTGDIVMCKSETSFPKYNIYKKDGDYFIDIALAGYAKDDIKIKFENDFLFIAGLKEKKEKIDYIYKGISDKKWKLMFQLGESIDVDKLEASFKDGILTIKLPVTKEKKEKVIEIK